MTSRLDVSFASGNSRCSAWLYLPSAGEKPLPVIVMAHGLGAIRHMRLDMVAERFRNAGYACLVFDYRHFGDSDGNPRNLLSISRQLEDWRSAISYARSRTELDAKRVILWGTSFSGGHVMRVGAQDGCVAAVMSQCPFTSGFASAMAQSTRTALKLTLLGVVDRIGSIFGAAPLLVDVAGPANAAALMTAPDALPGYLALVPEGKAYSNKAAARIALDISCYYPGRSAAEINCPLLVHVCETDSVAPSGPTLRYARQAKKAEVVLCSEGHFEIYGGEAFERVNRQQLEFLRHNVPV
ncbi:alpha/beta hydrolase [Pantoea sp. Cy-639]|uniref:alpha/beta hydrolase n=1 Tax=Pantoea sp. Cy-639 TaxID=2608360 RepID=UPI0014220EFA|nr:alpha/beta hydrolase [Pantoea sp. Cy-639]NIF15617.1 alpha/beta hydrolase [Pantoea sp. Cy-639]